MFLTQYDLDEVQKKCESLVEVIKNVKLSKDYRDMFATRASAEEAKRAQNHTPEVFYEFRFFDIYTTIHFHSRFQKYTILCKNFYSPIFDKYSRTQRGGSSFVISSSLTDTLDVWLDVVQDIVGHKVLQNGLF